MGPVVHQKRQKMSGILWHKFANNPASSRADHQSHHQGTNCCTTRKGLQDTSFFSEVSTGLWYAKSEAAQGKACRIQTSSSSAGNSQKADADLEEL